MTLLGKPLTNSLLLTCSELGKYIIDWFLAGHETPLTLASIDTSKFPMFFEVPFSPPLLIPSSLPPSALGRLIVQSLQKFAPHLHTAGTPLVEKDQALATVFTYFLFHCSRRGEIEIVYDGEQFTGKRPS